ncbi:MAG: ribokinase [Atopobiaceae bacterium]|jgi:ribokinase
MAKVIVFGSLNMDLSVVCGHIPRAGETLMGSGFFTNAGGKGGNQAVAAARSGVETYMIARVGQDEFGTRLKDGLEWYGVNCSYIKRAEGYPTGTAMIIRCEEENRIIVDPGANLALDAEGVIREFDEIAEPGDVLLTQLECSLDTTAALLAHARECKVTTVLNAAPAIELPDSVYASLDLLCVNENECDQLSGIYPADRWRWKDALGYFAGKGVKNTIITLGKRGSTTMVNDVPLKVDGIPVVAVDTTGAGDAYLGMLAAELLRGATLVDAMKKATAASALAVQKPGAQRAMPTVDEVEKFLAQLEQGGAQDIELPEM